MPPPMSMVKHDFQNNIVAVSKNRESLLVVTEQQIYLFDMNQNKVTASAALGDLKNQHIYGVKLLNTNPI